VGYIDKTGKVVINPQFDNFGQFSEGLANVRIGHKEGYIDKTGKFVINPQFDDVGPFSDGLAPIRIGYKLGYIDKTGKIVWMEGEQKSDNDNFLSLLLTPLKEIVDALKVEFKKGHTIAGPPQGAKDAIRQKVENIHDCGSRVECKDFNITCSHPLEITHADKANGVEEKWCIKIDFIGRTSMPSHEWVEYSDVYKVQRHNGN
jgi:hypothetical protein